MKFPACLSCTIVALSFPHTAAHAGFNERKLEAQQVSTAPKQVKGGEKFTCNTDYAAAFDCIVRTLKQKDLDVVLADREAGMIATEIEISGGWRQTGTRIVISLTKDSPAATTVRVVVTEQKRYKALQVEPWSDPLPAAGKSGPIAQILRAALAEPPPLGGLKSPP